MLATRVLLDEHDVYPEIRLTVFMLFNQCHWLVFLNNTHTNTVTVERGLYIYRRVIRYAIAPSTPTTFTTSDVHRRRTK